MGGGGCLAPPVIEISDDEEAEDMNDVDISPEVRELEAIVHRASWSDELAELAEMAHQFD